MWYKRESLPVKESLQLLHYWPGWCRTVLALWLQLKPGIMFRGPVCSGNGTALQWYTVFLSEQHSKCFTILQTLMRTERLNFNMLIHTHCHTLMYHTHLIHWVPKVLKGVCHLYDTFEFKTVLKYHLCSGLVGGQLQPGSPPGLWYITIPVHFVPLWFLPGDLEAFKKQAFVLKEGVEYKIKISFKVRVVATFIYREY